jgi:hypothetical protein
MSFTDHVPYYDNYEYKVFVESDGRRGKQVIEQNISFGPTCQWKVAMTSSDFHGWKGNYISVYNIANTEIGQCTTTSSSPTVEHINMPVGRVKFVWNASNDTIDNVSITIRDSQNAVVYQYSGSSANIPEGVFLTANNGCGNTGTCDAPVIVDGYSADNAAVIEWDGSLGDAYAFCVYRDDVIYRMVTDNSEPFIDENTGGIGHCYNVSRLCQNGESELSEMNCVSVGTSCDPARNLWFYTQNNGKPAITWDLPEHSSTLTGYYIYRKCNDGEYKRVKNLGPNKIEYKESTPLEAGNWYYYKVAAYYRDNDCYSIPAKSIYGNEYFVKIFYDPEHLGIDENLNQNVEIYPNPAKDLLTIKAENATKVVIYSSIGQKVYEKSVDSSEISINTDGFDSGIYLVKVVADGDVVTRRISIVK